MLSPAEAWAKRVRTCGVVMTVCAGIHLLSCISRFAMGFVMAPMMRMYFEWLESMSPKVKVTSLFEPLEAFLNKIAIWQSVATVPFLICASWLLYLGIKTMKADREALRGARVWTFAAAGAIAISTAIQLAVILPATQVYTQAIANQLPAQRGGAPFDMGQMIGAITNAATLAGTVMNILMLSVFPIILFFWTKKLEKETPSPF
jgi:hypothetical protein